MQRSNLSQFKDPNLYSQRRSSLRISKFNLKSKLQIFLTRNLKRKLKMLSLQCRITTWKLRMVVLCLGQVLLPQNNPLLLQQEVETTINSILRLLKTFWLGETPSTITLTLLTTSCKLTVSNNNSSNRLEQWAVVFELWIISLLFHRRFRRHRVLLNSLMSRLLLKWQVS
jgi:hypothetical protein